MKYVVLLIVLVLAYAWWRGQRRASMPPPKARPPLPPPQDMVACHRCGVHLPRSDALARGGRSYCSLEHQHEDGF